MAENNLSVEEKKYLENFILQIESHETAQAQDLIKNCNNPYQFARTHSAYIEDWEKTRRKMETDLSNGTLPPGATVNLTRAIIDASDKVIQKKLEMARYAFQVKFGESIYNYLGKDGKTKGCFGTVALFIFTGAALLFLI